MSEEQGDYLINIPDEERISIPVEERINDQLIINDWKETFLGTNPIRERLRRIQKVPQTLPLNESNKKEYDPVVVSFGPYHHGKKDLQLAEKFKQTSLRIYVSACNGKSIEDLRKKVSEVIDTVRNCYVEGSTNKYNDTEFAEMMLLDGCLVLNLMDLIWSPISWLIYEHLGALGRSNLYRDLFLLENQLPYLVLQVLVSVRFDKEDQRNKIFDIVDQFFNFIFSRELFWSKKSIGSISQYEKQPPLHLLEFSRAYFLSKSGIGDSFRKTHGSDERVYDIKKYVHSFRSVTEMKAKGILSRPFISSGGKFETDINFKSYFFYGKLEIPPIFIAEYAKSRLLNLIAYEMCPNNLNDFRVTSYVRFMKKLIQHPDDVKELRTNNILLNVIGGDDEVVTMFKDIMAPAVNIFALDIVEENIQRHYNSKARTWIAELIAKYFSSPMTVIALLAAVVLLALAILQTHYTIHPTMK